MKEVYEGVIATLAHLTRARIELREAEIRLDKISEQEAICDNLDKRILRLDAIITDLKDEAFRLHELAYGISRVAQFKLWIPGFGMRWDDMPYVREDRLIQPSRHQANCQADEIAQSMANAADTAVMWHWQGETTKHYFGLSKLCTNPESKIESKTVLPHT